MMCIHIKNHSVSVFPLFLVFSILISCQTDSRDTIGEENAATKTDANNSGTSGKENAPTKTNPNDSSQIQPGYLDASLITSDGAMDAVVFDSSLRDDSSQAPTGNREFDGGDTRNEERNDASSVSDVLDSVSDSGQKGDTSAVWETIDRNFFFGYNSGGSDIVGVSVGSDHSCVLKSEGAISCSSFDAFGHDYPIDTDGPYIQLGGSCAIRSDNGIDCWGETLDNVVSEPPTTGKYIQVGSGANFSCALADDGTIVCWGSNDDGHTTAPNGIFRQISIGWRHSCAIGEDSRVSCWGRNDYGETDAPDGSFTQVSVGLSHSCGIKSDGSLFCWGNTEFLGMADLAGPFTEVASGDSCACAIRKVDAGIVCWDIEDGVYRTGELEQVPSGSYTQVSVDMNEPYACAIKASDGSLVCWGVPKTTVINGGGGMYAVLPTNL